MTPRRSGLARIPRWIEGRAELDPVGRALAGAVARLPEGPKAVLRGAGMGHPLHPVLTDVVIGCWTSAWLLDLAGEPGDGRSTELLLGIGLAAAVPTALAGAADAALLDARRRRVAVAHAAVNLVASGAFGASLVARTTGRVRAGVVLGHLGAGVATVGGFLGGCLAFEPVRPEVPSVLDAAA